MTFLDRWKKETRKGSSQILEWDPVRDDSIASYIYGGCIDDLESAESPRRPICNWFYVWKSWLFYQKDQMVFLRDCEVIKQFNQNYTIEGVGLDNTIISITMETVVCCLPVKNFDHQIYPSTVGWDVVDSYGFSI
jgi:hypothetical protein